MFSSVKVPLCYPSGTEDVQEGVNAACSSVLPSGYQQPVSAAPGDVMPGWLCRLHSPSLHIPPALEMRQGPQDASGTPACLRDPSVPQGPCCPLPGRDQPRTARHSYAHHPFSCCCCLSQLNSDTRRYPVNIRNFHYRLLKHPQPSGASDP